MRPVGGEGGMKGEGEIAEVVAFGSIVQSEVFVERASNEMRIESVGN